MAISLASAAQRARDIITEQGEAQVGFTLAKIKGLIPSVCELLARRVAVDPTRRHLLRPPDPYTATLVGGSVDLAAVINANKLLLDYFDKASIQFVDTSLNPYDFQWVGGPAQLQFKDRVDNLYVLCALQGTRLLTRNTDGALNTAAGDVNIWANFIPTIAKVAANSTFPFALEGEFCDLLALTSSKELGAK
jgi:hypothetical protein